MSGFKKYPGARFEENDVVLYLEELLKNGWEVYQGAKAQHYIIELDENCTVNLGPAIAKDKGWMIDSYKDGSIQARKWATNMAALRAIVSEHAKKLGFEIEKTPLRIRTTAATPLTNLQSIVTLAANVKVECIHDPYFDDKAISYLGSMVSLGLNVADTVRILSSKKVKNKLSSGVIDAFHQQTGSNLDIRLMDSGHRRFIMLSGGMAIILGWSLNNWNKDEAARLENGEQDFEIFNNHWDKATVL